IHTIYLKNFSKFIAIRYVNLFWIFVVKLKFCYCQSQVIYAINNKVFFTISLFGKTITKQLYKKKRHVLLYFNPSVKKRRTTTFLAQLETLEQAIAKILSDEKPAEEKQAAIKALLKKYHLTTCFSTQIIEDKVKCIQIEKKNSGKTC
ncbi:MAG: hypothetical protein ACTSYB_07285, partial [Candidatus Helarchaeota archaeon]